MWVGKGRKVYSEHIKNLGFHGTLNGNPEHTYLRHDVGGNLEQRFTTLYSRPPKINFEAAAIR